MAPSRENPGREERSRGIPARVAVRSVECWRPQKVIIFIFVRNRDGSN